MRSLILFLLMAISIFAANDSVSQELPAVGVKDISALSKMACLHEGRLKPFETFARHSLLLLSGRSTYEKNSATQEMARILFIPEKVSDDKLFLINNPEVLQALQMNETKRGRYSFKQMQNALAKLEELAQKAMALEDEKRDVVQKEILGLYNNMVFFVNLTQTFSFAMPSSVFTVQLPETRVQLHLPADAKIVSFWDLMSNVNYLKQILEAIGKRSEAERSPVENEVVRISQAMYFSSQAFRTSPFKIIPTVGNEKNDWVSPGDVLTNPNLLHATNNDLELLAQMAKNYRNGQQAEFTENTHKFSEIIDGRAYEQLQNTHFNLEVLYQKFDPYYLALIGYWFGLILCFSFFLFSRKWLYHAAYGITALSFVIHLSGIISRIIIMQRPPVTSLYETFPFVAAVAILVAGFIEKVSKKGIGILASSLLGVILLSIANRYAAEGDTLKMLVAVLNSNFWLSTHVICVTIGYSACILAGAIGHFWLVHALWPSKKGKKERSKEIEAMVYGVLCFGLLFSFFGTVLGGIWADQSWGRFWGWDPKENGALLIVIWCIILLHAKLYGYIKAEGLAQGAVFGSIVVALAWFGVNLLNVGLHSYGFTQGAATKLMSYIGFELGFMLICGIGLFWQRKKLR